MKATEIADQLERTDVEAFAWLLDLIFDDPADAEDAKGLIVSLLRRHINEGIPTKEEIEFCIDHTEPPFIEELKDERELWIADNMRHEILERVRSLKAGAFT